MSPWTAALVQIVLSIALSLLALGGAWIAQALHARVRNARVLALLDAAERVVGVLVAAAQQTDVDALKARGPWTVAEATRVKALVLADAKAHLRPLLEQLEMLGVHATERLVDRLIEAHVRALPPALPGAVTTAAARAAAQTPRLGTMRPPEPSVSEPSRR